ncbi:hypothetical protein PQ455_11780 [Sphingomonas naphthae]|uniref:Uncharacterized protein n=1 Tax=Sphingomonas naphthae TaxID=1813468 RepID=A0ABY7TGG4_9SPHN|nr:hypothetical protein [Sphingomonas naphthae]WCT72316.1 hypothetical protein PQ455_11780 [Sphingomonas naphthae]
MNADDLFMFICILVFMGSVTKVVLQMLKTREARHLARADGGSPQTGRAVALLSDENELLTGKIGRLEERIATLERIATDRPRRLADEIDSLR